MKKIKKTLITFFVAFCSILTATNLFAQNFQWAKQISGTSPDEGRFIALDAAGNIYSTGFFQGTVDFDPGPGTFNLTAAGSNDIYICKLDFLGNFVWARQMGGTFSDEGRCIALDASGNIYTTGIFNRTADFDPGPGTFNLTAVGVTNPDIFISKLDTLGNFVWARRFGAFNPDFANFLAIDATGNVYTTGAFSLTVDFDPGPGTSNLTASGPRDFFISKLDASGNFVWARRMGGPINDQGNSIAFDASGNVYTTGFFRGTADFDPGPGTFNLTSTGSLDNAFIYILNASGNFVWALQMGGTRAVNGKSLVLDAAGNIYITGDFSETADFDPGPGTFNLTSIGHKPDIFVSKLDNLGNFVWAKALGGSGQDIASQLAINTWGNVYSVGVFEETADFDPGPDTFNVTSAGIWDNYISKLDALGNFVWACQIGGTGWDAGIALALDDSANVYTTGMFGDKVDFDPGPGTFHLTSAGSSDIFISKLYAVTAPPIPEINWANLQHPPLGSIEPLQQFNVYGRALINGVTGSGNATDGLQAWVGYHTENTHPENWINWIPAAFNDSVGNYDEFIANLGQAITMDGTYYYAYRYQYLDQDFVYGGYSEAGGGFWEAGIYISGVLAVATSTTPENRIVDGQTIGNNETECFDATNNITVSNSLISPGATVEFRAGVNILFADGFIAQEGSYVLAIITDVYCTLPLAMLASEEVVIPAEMPVVASSESMFRAYPNPTSGILSLEIGGAEASSKVLAELYNMMGNRMLQQEISSAGTYAIDLSAMPRGIYILRIIIDGKTEVQKIFRQ